MAFLFNIASDVADAVRPAWAIIEPVVVLERDDRMNDPLRAAASAMRTSSETTDVTAAVRAMYRRFGLDPTKTRPSSEALLRRVRKGEDVPRINSLVDVINWCSLESRMPFGLYDAGRIRGGVTLRIGRPGESYPGIRKDDVHLADRLTLADDAGPFGNPTSDSARTMVTPATTAALVVIFAPAAVPQVSVDRALADTRDRAGRYCQTATQPRTPIAVRTIRSPATCRDKR